MNAASAAKLISVLRATFTYDDRISTNSADWSLDSLEDAINSSIDENEDDENVKEYYSDPVRKAVFAINNEGYIESVPLYEVTGDWSSDE